MKHRVALVTGASRGIGAGIAQTLASHHIAVAVGYARNREKAKAVVDSIAAQGGIATAVEVHNESRQSIKDALELIAKTIGGVDILINNGAIAQEKPFLTLTDDDWDQMLEINLKGAFMATQEVLPRMIDQQWGRIINISSIGGQWGGMNQIHYATAKAGLIGLTRSIAKVYSAYNITCNAIAPGLIGTEMSEAELNTPAGQDKVKNIPRKKLGTVEDIGEAALYLASDQANYVTGQTLNLNGGMYFG
jgi:acetoacetyl-CoA reductase/3-oxoacyl-[acyl-carrier protein] reductase